MGGRRSLMKGKAAEREFANLVMRAIAQRDEVQDIVLKRNLAQTDEGGYDLDGVPGLAIEVKRQEKMSISKWWTQAVVQAGRQDYLRGLASVGAEERIPVLAYRQNRMPWTVLMPLSAVQDGRTIKATTNGPYVRELGVEQFIEWLVEFLIAMGQGARAAPTKNDFVPPYNYITDPKSRGYLIVDYEGTPVGMRASEQLAEMCVEGLNTGKIDPEDKTLCKIKEILASYT